MGAEMNKTQLAQGRKTNAEQQSATPAQQGQSGAPAQQAGGTQNAPQQMQAMPFTDWASI